MTDPTLPTDSAKLLKLAERCVAATGPDRRLDIEILVAIDWREPDWEEGERTVREMAERHGFDWLTSRAVEGYNSIWRHLPRLTASLDAAMSLLEGAGDFRATRDSDGCRAIVWLPWRNVGFDANAATPALALCAAALRAIAAQGGTHAE